ncbi:MAG: Asp-tRNA(Asn)/Glu-tRNA(Gln) amidotransferase subunit GatA [Verrucomicrobiota bacterium]
MPELYEHTAVELIQLLESGQTSARDIMSAFLDRTNAVESQINAFNAFDADDALRQAEASDSRRKDGTSLGLLDGIPVALKDVIAVKDQPLTASSKILQEFVSPYDSHVTELLKQQGAVLFGRLNLDEFAMGSSTENSGFQRTSNPWNLDCVPGGSSGGSAAAVAALEAPLTLGSDTGGSIRQPAAFCGVVGMKPTYGLVSRYGLIAFASSLDQIGPFTRTVEDAAILLQGIVGHDRRDSTSIKMEVPDYRAALGQSADKKWRLGIPKEYFGDGLDPEVRAAVDTAIKTYESQGHEIIEVSLPTTDLAVPVYYIIAPAEASSNLSRYDGIRYGHRSDNARNAIDVYYKSRAEGFGAEVKRRIILGSYVLSSGYYDAYYLKAQKARTIIRNDFNAAFEKCDALLTPTTPTAAFKAGEKTSDPLSMYLSDIFTINVNLAGLPGISVPCGFTSDGLPIGLQVIGQAFKEADLLSIAHAYERQHNWHQKTAAL